MAGTNHYYFLHYLSTLLWNLLTTNIPFHRLKNTNKKWKEAILSRSQVHVFIEGVAQQRFPDIFVFELKILFLTLLLFLFLRLLKKF